MAIPALLAALVFLLLLGLIGIIRAGLSAHLPLAMALGVYSLYCAFTPALLWARGEFAIAGINYGAHFTEALGVYLFGISVLLAAYAVLPGWSFTSSSITLLAAPSLSEVSNLWRLTAAGFLISLHLAGIFVISWFHLDYSHSATLIWGRPGGTAGIDIAADAWVACTALFLAFYPRRGAVVVALTIGALLLVGPRYRILLTLGAGGLFLWLSQYNRLLPTSRPRLWMATLGFITLLAISLAWLTLNRAAMANRRYDQLRWDITLFDARELAHETNNAQTFMVLLGYYHGQGLSPDHGLTSVGYLVGKPLPARFWPGGRKPPAPILAHLRAAYDQTRWGRRLNPAITNLEEYYLTAGILGLLLGMTAIAALCRGLSALLASSAPLATFAGCLGTLWLVQLISRGYLPQQVQLAVVLALPLALLVASRRLIQPR